MGLSGKAQTAAMAGAVARMSLDTEQSLADCSVPDESEPLASGEVDKQRSMASTGAEGKDRN